MSDFGMKDIPSYFVFGPRLLVLFHSQDMVKLSIKNNREYVDSGRAEICRVLKPGGRFAMVTMGRSLIGKIIFGWLYSLRTYSNKKMKSMLHTAGFSIVEVETRWGGDPGVLRS